MIERVIVNRLRGKGGDDVLDAILGIFDRGDLGNPGRHHISVGGKADRKRVGIDGWPALAQRREQDTSLEHELRGMGRAAQARQPALDGIGRQILLGAPRDERGSADLGRPGPPA